MVDEEFRPFLIGIEKFAERLVEGVDEIAGEHSDHGQNCYYPCDDTEKHVFKLEPSEHEENNHCDKKQHGDNRRKMQARTLLIGLLHHLSGGRISIFHPLLERRSFLAFFDMRLEEEGAESRRKGEGVDSRKEDCHCHSQTELTVEHARCATHERHGNKHEHHDERD